MRRNADPLSDPAPLIRRVYAYVAYRIGDGPEAEDVSSQVFERALRYRSSYDPDKASPITWLMAIARRVLADRGGAAETLGGRRRGRPGRSARRGGRERAAA